MTDYYDDEAEAGRGGWTITSGPAPASATEDGRGCIMQRAAVEHARRHGYLDRVPLEKVVTDQPCWANACLTVIAIHCNDSITDDDERQRLRPLLDRVLLASRRDEETEKRINARILCHQARKVLHLFEDRFPDDVRPRKAVEAREAWLAGEVSEDEAARAAWAAGDAGATGAARAAWAARAAGGGWAAEAAAAARAAGAAGATDWVEWLDDALDDWEKAAAEEGALGDETEAERLVAEFVQAAGS